MLFRSLGIDWMTLSELSESIPPAYAQFIGHFAMRRIHELAAMRLALSVAASAPSTEKVQG